MGETNWETNVKKVICWSKIVYNVRTSVKKTVLFVFFTSKITNKQTDFRSGPWAGSLESLLQSVWTYLQKTECQSFYELITEMGM